jgi:hypothetical protein
MNATTPRFVGCSNLHRKAGHVGHGNKSEAGSEALHCWPKVFGSIAATDNFHLERKSLKIYWVEKWFQMKVAEELTS